MSFERLEGKIKTCGRCLKEISCMANTQQVCACMQLSLRTETLEFLKKTAYDCLCNTCLSEINELVAIKKEASNKLKENIHFYYEDSFLVFKELYHIQRGYCCKSNCRHCAYGFKYAKS
ncbi:MAG: cysteine-rich CWC family protein [Chitinophagales bacterium]|nr:cysteine-rich CWC family protein [Chitinophagales bacterium]